MTILEKAELIVKPVHSCSFDFDITEAAQEIVRLSKQVSKYEVALCLVMSQAGVPDASEACRLIISTALSVLNHK